ncbi:hydrogenase expression/formation protein HypE [Methanothermobacter wolfeii]|uniref:Hydrogenase expression/formation protein HypE n=1 Tax=Methanothermobacter wolfeii TaxID=145261 RepID=A0A9E7RU46_METWO|nr:MULTISPECIES: hydrogenase expression/formation protein HypE [Methanothermobacter]NLM02813.1 hydrogenase expression/formation protein HypE [Methanothermobacter wolfeii]QHN06123.1 hydrogenase expression/formation protein HypE [Methanothermobacter sp. THM-1]UXH32320.1 hydrogenase expression/formation protein HypE [Methanothermobacter wolfeii]
MKIGMSHGAGGELMQDLISDIILSNIRNTRVNGGVGLEDLDDGASIPLGEYEIVISTDGHTIDPLFFPGGDIGKIAVAGTVNDISVMGARPIAIASAMVLSEGFRGEELERIVRSMDAVSEETGVSIITGDTKVMEKDKLDRMIITTTGIGVVKRGEIVRDSGLRPGDMIILTGSVGDHGMALMAFREGFGYDTELESDVAPVWEMVEAALSTGGVTAMKDPTRGGIANALNELAEKSGVGMVVEEERIPVKEEVLAVSEMLGIDPYEVANEGKVIIGVDPEYADEVLDAIRKTRYGGEAQIIGEVNSERHVILETRLGGRRILEAPVADPVPRVC